MVNVPTPPPKSAGLPTSGKGRTLTLSGRDEAVNGACIPLNSPPATATTPARVMRPTARLPGWTGNNVACRTTAKLHACIANLQQIDGAIQMWATETKQGETATVTAADVLPYLKNAVTCPSGGKTFSDSYSVTTVAARPTCLKQPGTHKLEETVQ